MQTTDEREAEASRSERWCICSSAMHAMLSYQFWHRRPEMAQLCTAQLRNLNSKWQKPWRLEAAQGWFRWNIGAGKKTSANFEM